MVSLKQEEPHTPRQSTRNKLRYFVKLQNLNGHKSLIINKQVLVRVMWCTPTLQYICWKHILLVDSAHPPRRHVLFEANVFGPFGAELPVIKAWEQRVNELKHHRDRCIYCNVPVHRLPNKSYFTVAAIYSALSLGCIKSGFTIDYKRIGSSSLNINTGKQDKFTSLSHLLSFDALRNISSTVFNPHQKNPKRQWKKRGLEALRDHIYVKLRGSSCTQSKQCDI